MDISQIQEYWEEIGKRSIVSDVTSATTHDYYLGLLEGKNISEFLKSDDVVLDIGCGDARHTLQYSMQVARLFAVDTSPSFVQIAQQRVASHGVKNMVVSLGSSLDLSGKFAPSSFDCVISQRCLINLPFWEYQRSAILEILKVLKGGGLLLLTEGFQEGMEHINEARLSVGLPKIIVAPHNRLLKLEEFSSFIKQHFDVVAARDYGAYFYLSHIFHPLVVWPDSPKHESHLNEVAMRVAQSIPILAMAKYSYNLFYALRKR